VRRCELTERKQFERCIEYSGRWSEFDSRRAI